MVYRVLEALGLLKRTYQTVHCPRCGSDDIYIILPEPKIWRCQDCRLMDHPCSFRDEYGIKAWRVAYRGPLLWLVAWSRAIWNVARHGL